MATISDVARRAGVSTSTVSYALSGKRPISPSTRNRVERAAAALGYSPNAGARALAMAKTHVIGLMAPFRPGVDINVVMHFVSGITSAAHDSGYDILLVTDDDVSGVKRVTQASMVDALVVMDIAADDPRIPLLDRLSCPVVLIGLPDEPGDLTCIDLDFERAGALAANHLLGLGHRRVALVGSPPQVLARGTSFAQRINRGFATAAAAAGAEHFQIQADPVDPQIRPLIGRLMEQAVTGLVVHNELALPQVVSVLGTHGKRVPRDVSLIAVAPETVAASLGQPVTNVELPAESIGRMAVELAVSRVDDGNRQPPEVRLIRPHLVDRGTTGPLSN